MQNTQKPPLDDEERIRVMMQKIDDEYMQLGKNISRLVLDVSHRIDGYVDEIIELKQKREENDL